MSLYGEASYALGKLNEMGVKLPNQKRLIKAYIIKEALLTSAIENIHTTLIDVFTSISHETKPDKNTQLVLNYTKALDAALYLLQQKGLPLVSRVILSAHEALMSIGEGDKATPGLYRKQSVMVGNLIPPPAPEIPQLMSTLEHYINEPSELPPLIRAGLVHVQFETIHPFLDGNGRIGRLLIVLMLIDNGLLTIPILYPSYYFKKYHFEYYQHLDRVRTHGDFEGWITYYLKAIRDSAIDAYKRAEEIEQLKISLNHAIQASDSSLKTKETTMLIMDFLFTQPITSIIDVSKNTGKSYNTVSTILKQLCARSLISEKSINKRSKMYCFDSYLALLEKRYD